MIGYSNIYIAMERHSRVLRDARCWRVVNPPIQGEVNGFPQSRGWLIATNGVLCWIENPFTDRVFEGHMGWFIPDKEENLERVAELTSAPLPRLNKLEERYAL